jgi:iron-sulfur cluster repair protein YtfE (RIC family)
MKNQEKPQDAEELLSEDHEALAKLLGALQDAIDEGDYATLFANLDLFWARLAMHIRAEHLHLFPSILKTVERDSASSDVQKAIAQLRSDHDFFMDELSSAIKILREAKTRAKVDFENDLVAVRGIIKAVSDRLEVHNELEEEIVYLLPATMLPPHEQKTLAGEIKVELENLPPRFSSGSRS